MHGIRRSSGKITFALQGHHSSQARVRVTTDGTQKIDTKLKFTISPGKLETVKNGLQDLEYFVAADEHITIPGKRAPNECLLTEKISAFALQNFHFL